MVLIVVVCVCGGKTTLLCARDSPITGGIGVCIGRIMAHRIGGQWGFPVHHAACLCPISCGDLRISLVRHVCFVVGGYGICTWGMGTSHCLPTLQASPYEAGCFQ